MKLYTGQWVICRSARSDDWAVGRIRKITDQSEYGAFYWLYRDHLFGTGYDGPWHTDEIETLNAEAVGQWLAHGRDALAARPLE